MVSRKVRKLMRRGLLEETKDKTHAVIHKDKKYETAIIYKFYMTKVRCGTETRLDDYIVEELAKFWELYFDIGREKYLKIREI